MLSIRHELRFIMFFTLAQISLIFSVNAQEIDTMVFSSLPKDKYSLLLDDTYIISGLNFSGLYYSKNFRQLSYAPSYFVGIEQYFPSKGKFFTSFGLNVSNRPFRHHTPQNALIFNNLYADVPLSFSYELPVFRNFDFRFIVGGFFSLRLASWTRSSYSDSFLDDPSNFAYNTADFKRTDFGWHFGLSAEHKNYIFRLRCLSGFNNLDRREQGMINGLSMEMGYFLFRDKRLRK
jgi:hypothetical protein